MKLEVKNLSKKFGRHQVLKDINLLIDHASTLVLLGPSGGGKSTFLRILAGLQPPDEGWIAFNDKKIIFEENELREHRRSLGIVFQSFNLFPHLTTLENIMLPLYHVHGFSKEEAENRSLELLKRFELDKQAQEKPYTLSGGQSQRVALIRAIAAQPALLLLDEPTSALDPLMTAEVLDLILELKKEGNQLVLVTHHLQFAKKIADYVLFLADEKVLEQGSVDKVFNHPESPQAKHYMSKVLSY